MTTKVALVLQIQTERKIDHDQLVVLCNSRGGVCPRRFFTHAVAGIYSIAYNSEWADLRYGDNFF